MSNRLAQRIAEKLVDRDLLEEAANGGSVLLGNIYYGNKALAIDDLGRQISEILQEIEAEA